MGSSTVYRRECCVCGAEVLCFTKVLLKLLEHGCDMAANQENETPLMRAAAGIDDCHLYFLLVRSLGSLLGR